MAKERHGHYANGTRTPTYNSWRAMKARCYQVNHMKYPTYGGAGVKVSDEWVNSFVKFLEDMGVRPKGKTLDRINPKGNYCKENCRWASSEMQARNRRKP